MRCVVVSAVAKYRDLDRGDERGLSQQIEKVWRIRGPGGATTECSIYQEPDGNVSMQVSRLPGSEVLHMCRVATIRRARRKAEEWRRTLLALGEFHDCSVEMSDQGP
jgi:hypothetical protein